jgi:hypothetical protein
MKYNPEKSLLQLRREIIETAKQLEMFKLGLYGLVTYVDGMIQAAQHAKTLDNERAPAKKARSKKAKP